MAIEATARNKEIPAKALDYAREKAAAIEKDFDKVSQVRAVLDSERHLFKAQFEAIVRGDSFSASAENADNFVKAIDDAWDKLFAQIRKHGERIGDNRKA